MVIEIILSIMVLIDIVSRYLALCFGVMVIPYSVFNLLLAIFNKARKMFRRGKQYGM